MSELAIMAMISVVSGIINYYVTNKQSDKEFGRQQLLQEDAQQFQADREDIMFERNNIPSQYQQMLDSGFNPILAANSIMGGNGVAAASSDSAPSAPTTNSAINALSSMISQSGKNLYDALKDQAEIKNIQANTDMMQVQTGIMPRDFNLRQLSTTKQLEVWDASIKRTQAAEKLDDAQAALIRQQNLYYGRMAEAQIQAYESQVADNFASASLKLEQINTEKAKQTELGTQSALNLSEISVNVDEKILLQNQSAEAYYKSESARIAKEFEESLGGIPLTADAQKYVQFLAKKGDIEGIKNFYMNIFTTAKNQQLGSEYGTAGRFGLPFNLFQGRPNTDLIPKPYGYGAPLWNPVN